MDQDERQKEIKYLIASCLFFACGVTLLIIAKLFSDPWVGWVGLILLVIGILGFNNTLGVNKNE